MKNFNLFLAALFVAVLGLTIIGCKKTTEIIDVVNEDQNISENNYNYQLPELLKKGVTVENGIMVFKDAENYFEITELLIAENNKWNEDFYNEWKELIEEDFNAKIVELKFDCDYTFKVFEEYHNFISLRSKIEEANNLWLGHEELDMEMNPNLYAIPANERSVYNKFGEYIVNGFIYNIQKDGMTFEIANYDYELLSKVRNNEIDIFKQYKNLKIYNIEIDACKDCVPGAFNNDYQVYSSHYGVSFSHKLVCDVTFNGYNGTSARGYGNMWTYKLVNGVWQTWSTRLEMNVGCNFYTLDCDFILNKTDSQTKTSGSSMTVGVSRLGIHRSKPGECCIEVQVCPSGQHTPIGLCI